MKDEYIIISKTAILKRIEELEKGFSSEKDCEDPIDYLLGEYKGSIYTLKHILSQSTPLIPVLKDTFKASKIPYKVNDYGTFGYENVEHYIETLKLDI